MHTPDGFTTHSSPLKARSRMAGSMASNSAAELAGRRFMV
jgi:hypothetical protein